MSHLPSTIAIARTLLLAGILLAVTVLAARSFFPAFAQETIDDPEEIKYAENGTNPVATFTATDPEGETIDWSLSGEDYQDANNNDADIFAVDGGVLTFVKSPDFESPIDTGDNNTYAVTVQASDGTTMLSTYFVVVEVINVDEMGTIELSSLAPKEGVNLTATLTDPDGELTSTVDESVEWKWERSEDGLTGWEFSATSTPGIDAVDDDNKSQTTHTPSADDAGHFLRVTATYNDGEGMGKEADVVSDNKVVMKDYVNSAPRFVDDLRTDAQIEANSPAAATSRGVMENVSGGTVVGAPVRATDTDAANNPEVLTYSLSATNNDVDADPFEINSSTGQITVKSGANLDRERAEGSDVDADNDSMYEGP